MNTATPLGSRNVVVECVSLLPRIRDIWYSNLVPEAGYTNLRILILLGLSRHIPGQYPNISRDRFLQYPLKFIIHESYYHSMLHILRL